MATAAFSFGTAQQRINALAEMYAQAMKRSHESQIKRIFNDIVTILYCAADLYASQFPSLSACERDRISSQVLDRLVKMVGWYNLEQRVPFSAFVAKEFKQHPNTPPSCVIKREARTTNLTKIDPESGEEYIPKEKEISESSLSLSPLQDVLIAECYARLKHCIGEDESTDDLLLEKWGVVFVEHIIQRTHPLPMRFRASLFSHDYRVAQSATAETLIVKRDMFVQDPYLKRRLWL